MGVDRWLCDTISQVNLVEIPQGEYLLLLGSATKEETFSGRQVRHMLEKQCLSERIDKTKIYYQPRECCPFLQFVMGRAIGTV